MAGTAFLVFSHGAKGQDSANLQRLEQQFQEQSNPVRRAKDLGKLSKEEIRAVRAEILTGQIDQAADRVDRYRDEVCKTEQALMASGIDAVRKPGGFQELQIAIRESVGKLRDIILAVPLNRRRRFEAARDDLVRIDNQLLQELFPPPPVPRARQQEKR
jgi:hypothetical protein